jgi:hypothetical protein
MAVGNQITTTGVNNQLAADAAYILSFYYWLTERYDVWNQNLSTATQMSAAGFTQASDQNTITALAGDMNRLIQVFQGTNPGTFDDIRFNCHAVKGVN